MFYYSPHTQELINTDNPQDWMLSTDIEPTQTSNAFFVDGAWEYRADYVEPKPSYKELRQAAYPPASDYLDGLVKGDTAQMQVYIDKCLAVKAQFPKEQV